VLVESRFAGLRPFPGELRKSLMERKPFDKNKRRIFDIRERIRKWWVQVKELHGCPHYVALGLAIGVFVAATPTFPFQTAIALGLAYILRGSGIAAAVGTWVSNPITISFFYLESFKTGRYLFGISNNCGETCKSISELLKQGLNVASATILGSVIIEIPGGVVTYFLTRMIIIKIRFRKKAPSRKTGNSRL